MKNIKCPLCTNSMQLDYFTTVLKEQEETIQKSEYPSYIKEIDMIKMKCSKCNTLVYLENNDFFK